MRNELSDVWFWAKCAGLCKSILNNIDEDGRVWLTDDDKQMLTVLSEIEVDDAIKLSK